MARRDSVFRGIADVAGRLPWKVGVALAMVSFVALHALSAKTVPPLASPRKIGVFSSQTGIEFLAIVAHLMQLIVPPAFLIGAGVSYIRQRRGAGALAQAASGGSEAIAATSHVDFELLVGAALRNAGYQVVNQALPGPDGGVDLVVEKNRQRVLVQCKHWKSKTVGIGVVREIAGVVASRRADGAMVFASGRFTEEARKFAQRSGVELFDGVRLSKLIQCRPNHSDETPRKSAAAAPSPNDGSAATSPPCPKCGEAMVKRTARHGPYAGRDFWACCGYPSCRGIINIPT